MYLKMKSTLDILPILFTLYLEFFGVCTALKEQCFKNIFCIPADYDKVSRPSKGVVEIDLRIDVVETTAFDDKEFTATIMMYLRTAWNEPRVKSNSSMKIPMDSSIMKLLWLPDLYIYNMKEFKTERILTDFSGIMHSCNKLS